MYDVKTLDGRFLMSPRNDFTFKVLFGSENNKHLLSSLVSSIIREPVNEITLCNPYLIRKYQYEKEGVLDIKLKNKTGLQVFIEMQAYDYKSMNKRMLFYWAKMYSDQLPKGKDYSELNRTIGINILGYPGLLCDQPFSCYQVLEKRVHEVYCETFEIHVLKLAKNDIHERCINNKELLAWFTFLRATTEEEMIMAAEAMEAVSEAFETLNVISQDKEIRDLYDSRQRFLLDQATRERDARDMGIIEGIDKGIVKGIVKGRAEGIVEGRAEGIVEGRAEGVIEGRASAINEIIHNMIENGMEIQDIARKTGISEDEIRSILLE